MIRQIQALQKIVELNALKHEIRFNASLPVGIEVLKKLGQDFNGLQYLLQVGNRQLETRSASSLDVGMRYWGEVKQDKEGNTLLSHLVQKPLLFQKKGERLLDSLPILKEEHWQSSSLSRVEDFKIAYLEKMATASTKEEFSTLQNVALGFNHHVATLCIEDEEKKRSLVQFRTKSLQGQLDFYALFSNLGALRGGITMASDAIGLTLHVSYKSVQSLLQTQTKTLQGFDYISIIYDKQPPLLWNIEPTLLNLKG